MVQPLTIVHKSKRGHLAWHGRHVLTRRHGRSVRRSGTAKPSAIGGISVHAMYVGASKMLSGPEREPCGEKVRHGPRAESSCRMATCMAANKDYGVPDEADVRYWVAGAGGRYRCCRRRRSRRMRQSNSLIGICTFRHSARGRAVCQQVLMMCWTDSRGVREQRAVASTVGMSDGLMRRWTRYNSRQVF